MDEEGLSGRVEFRSWDKRDLDHSDGKFEAAVCPYAREPRARGTDGAQDSGQAVKPGGLTAVKDGDF